MKALKWVLGLSALLVLLVVAAAAALIVFVDPNQYKPWLERTVREATGRELRIEGDLQLTVFPWLGTRVEGVRLADAPGFGDAPMVEVAKAQLRVALLPLLKGELRADEVVLEGARIRLARDAAGRSNWEDLVQAVAKQGTAEPETSPSGAPPIRSFMIGGIRLEDAAVHWTDARTGTTLDLAPLELHTGALEPGRPVDVSLQARMKTGEPEMHLTVKIESRVHPGSGGSLSMDPLVLELAAQGPALEGRRLTATLQGPLSVSPQGPQVQAAGLGLKARVHGEGLPADGIGLTLRTSFQADLAPGKGTLEMAPLKLDLDGIPLEGELRASGLPQQPAWRLRLASAPFDPRAMLQRWGVELRTADPEVLKRARLELQARGGADAVELQGLEAELDDTRLQADGSVRGFSRPVVRFNAEIDALDADRYLPPAPAGSGAPEPDEAGDGTDGEEAIALPAEVLRELDLDGRVRLGRLQVSGIRMQDLTARIRARNGRLAVEPFGVALYGGRVEGGASVDVRKEVPRFSTHVDARSIAVGELLADVQESAARIRGTGALSARLATQGERVSQLKRALSGQVSFSLVEGSLRDRKLARTLEHVIAFLENREPRPAGEEIIFEAVRATGKIRDGVLRNDDLEVVTPLVLAKGEGTVDIGADTVDYVLRVALATGPQEQKRLFVPITVRGPFEKLDYGLDLTAVARERALQAAKEKAARQVEEQLEQIAPDAAGAMGEALKKGLGGLLGR